MASTSVESNPNSPPSGGLMHVIWTNQEDGVERFFHPKAPPKYVTEGHREGSALNRPISNPSAIGAGLDPVQRVYRLERSLRFLKTEHQKMLVDLQQEVDRLKLRNRELQFHLVVGKPLATVTEVEDAEPPTTGTPRSFGNVSTQTDDPVAPVSSSSRFNHLEEELSNLRQALDDAETRNSALSSLVSQLKRSHIKLKSSSTVGRRQFLNSTTGILAQEPPPTSYAKQFQEYEDAIRRLRRENVEQKHELQHVRSSLDVYRGAARSADGIDTNKLPRISLPATARPNQARKTTELPYIHPHYLSGEDLTSKVGLSRSIPEQNPRPKAGFSLDGQSGMERRTDGGGTRRSKRAQHQRQFL